MEFERNFSDRGDVGAAFCAWSAEGPLVDLWGGVADVTTGRPFERDTLQVVFSCSKGLVAICLLVLVDTGRLDLAEPVCTYWPEFRKEHILAQHVVAHTARLAGLDSPVSLDEILDARHMSALLALQAPSKDPRAALTYHPLTYGWLCDELIVRIDGRTAGEFFAQEVAAPLELELWLGLPVRHEHRVARLELADTWPTLPMLSPRVLASDSFVRSIWGNPAVLTRESFPWNEPRFRAAEVPAVNAVGTARALAKLYANLHHVLSPQTLALGTSTLSRGWDEVVGLPRRFGAGFQLHTELRPYGPAEDGFGHTGAGGSVAGSWPSLGIGFAYVMNRLRDDEGDNRRATTLLDALHAAITAGQRPQPVRSQ